MLSGSQFRARWAISVVAVFAALLIRQALMHILGIQLAPFLLFYPAVFSIAILAGFWPGMLATMLVAVLTRYWTWRHLATLDTSSSLTLAIFLGLCVLYNLLAELYRRRQQRNGLRFRALMENMTNGFAYCKILLNDSGQPVDYVYLDVNSAFVALTGLPNVVGKRVSQVIPGIQRTHPELIEAYGRVALTRTPEQFEINLELMEKWFSVSAYCPREGYFVAIFENITERKRTEEALRESEERYRDVFYDSPLGIYRTSPEGRILMVNPVLVRLLGYESEAELLNCDLSGSQFAPNYSRAEFQRGLEAKGVIQGLEAEWLRRDGTTVYIRENARLVRDEAGRVAYYEGTVEDITEQKLAEKRVAHLASFPELNPSIVFEADLEGRITYLNPIAARQFPTLRATAPDHPLLQDWDALLALLKAEPHRTVTREVAAFDMTLLQSVNYLPGFAVVRAYCMDITERKLAEEARRESEETNRVTFEQAAVGIAYVSLSGNWLLVNDKLCAMLGYSSEELLGMTFKEVTHPEDLDVELVWRERLLSGKIRSYRLEKRYVRKDQGFLWVDLTVSMVHGATGAPSHLITVVEDVSERKLAEAEITRLNRALRALTEVNRATIDIQEERELLQKAVDIAVEVGGYPLVWAGYPEHNAEHSVTVAAVAGKASSYVAELEISWDKSTPSGRGPAGRALSDGVTTIMRDYTSDTGFALWHKVAEKHGISSLIAVPLRERGKPIAVLIVYAGERAAFFDKEVELVQQIGDALARGIEAIRSRKEAEAERDERLKAEEQLLQAQKLEAIGRLAGGIAHDFNNLLMVILAQSELLYTELDGAAQRRIDTVVQSARRAAELTGQLLAFSRKQPRQPTRTEVNDIVTGISEILRRLVGEDIDIQLSLCDDPWPVKIDHAHFEQVIMNLVVNARDAMPDGGRLTLETRNITLGQEYAANHPLVPAGDYALLAVTDTGSGMSAEVQTRIFEPFFTTKAQGKGTGLGLSMVYGIVKQSGGFIWVYSELGKGTCFKIYLPREAAAEVEEAAAPFSPPATVKRPGTILLVEDDDSLRDVISDFLSWGGHTVIAAGGPDEACRLALEHQEKIDLLLTDVVLKGGNARQLVQQLNAQGCYFRVLYMSGYTSDAIVHHGVLDPGILFLQKPFSQAALMEKVEEALSSSVDGD